MEKVVFAEFDTMDSAELAARNIRNKFEGISHIKIRYKFVEDDGYNDMEYVLLPPAAFSNGSFANSFPQSYTATWHRTGEAGDGIGRESTINVYTNELAAERIAGFLRAMGGLSIKISDRN